MWAPLLASMGVLVPSPKLGEPIKVVHVYADVTFKEASAAIERRFEAANPDIDLRFTLGGSGELAKRMSQSREADVFLLAGEIPRQEKPDFSAPRSFANTNLAIVTGAENGVLKTLTDLAQTESLLMPAVGDPANSYSKRLFAQAAQAYGRGWLGLVERRIDAQASDVRAVLAKVGSGDAEAGIVYATDAKAYAKVRSVAIPPGLNVTVTFYVGYRRGSEVRTRAVRFTEFMFSSGAQSLLKSRGFSSPLDPVEELPVLFADESLRLFVSKLNSMPQDTVKSEGSIYRGADLRSILGPAKGRQVRIAGADGLTVTVPLERLRRNGGVLVKMPDGNLQVVLPGEPSTRWVRWIRSIQVL